jgi:folate-dependent phosphoribosylglycinamide formyltransferase PurN
LRTVLCTCGGLYGALVLRRLRSCERLEICAVVRSSRVLDPTFGFVQGALGQIRRSGVMYSLYLWCSTTLADWLCSWTAIGVVPTRSIDGGPRVLTTRDINDAQSLEFMAGCAPDLLVSAFFNQRLHPAALALPKHACLNIHPSFLPDAKGVDPVFQALLSGAPLGVTVHFMTPELDAGRILAQQRVVVPAGASVFESTALCFREGAELLAAAIDRVADGARGEMQSSAGNYQSWPTPVEIAALRARGGALARVRDFVRLVGARWAFGMQGGA